MALLFYNETRLGPIKLAKPSSSCIVSDHSSVMNKSNTLFNGRRENLFKENISAFSVQGKSRSVSVFSEKSGNNHPKHFRKLIMYWYYENKHLELFVPKSYKSREKYALK
jgi:hypothetical protein